VILADTSVWADHLRSGNRRLARLLEEGRIAAHPFIVGELACGNLRERARILGLLERLPGVPVATHAEALELVESRRLAARGLGWVDVHLLASALLGTASLWSLDRPLAAAARQLGCALAADQ